MHMSQCLCVCVYVFQYACEIFSVRQKEIIKGTERMSEGQQAVISLVFRWDPMGVVMHDPC